MTPRRELKKYAKEAMSGKYGTIILGFVAVQALAVISSMVSSSLFPGTEKLDIVLGYAFSFILTLLVNVVAAGLNYMYLNIARGKAYSLNDLIYFYKHHPDRVIVATFFLAVLNVLTMLPYTIYGNTAEIGNSIESQITWLYKSLILMIVGMIVFQILSIPLEMTYYILADQPDIKGTEALKESIEMMHGNWGRYLMLKISFLPLMFLSVFTFYIALLWILPYLTMTETMFYRDLTGELTAQKEQEEREAKEFVNPMFGGTPETDDRMEAQSSTYSQESRHQFRNAEDTDSTTAAYAQENHETGWKEEMKESSENQNTAANEKNATSYEADREKSSAQTDAVQEEEDNEPKPWDEYFNSLR